MKNLRWINFFNATEVFLFHGCVGRLENLIYRDFKMRGCVDRLIFFFVFVEYDF